MLITESKSKKMEIALGHLHWDQELFDGKTENKNLVRLSL